MSLQEQFHVKFFNSRKELFSKTIEVLEKGDHIFLSGDRKRNTPLWHTYVRGTVIKINKEKQNLKLDFVEEENFKDEYKKIKILTSKFKEGNVKLSYQHGFRIDQERMFTHESGIVKKYNLSCHTMSYAKPFEIATVNPSTEFIKTIVPGDYVMVWSEPDRHQTSFLHYPVQGWLWSKNEETMEIEFIHPPRMDIQKFSCAPENKMTAYGFYRKLVYQISDMNVED